MSNVKEVTVVEDSIHGWRRWPPPSIFPAFQPTDHTECSMNSRALIMTLAMGAVVACGDPETRDRRGYTKAPLEDPGVLVEGEIATPMAALNRPDLVQAEEIELEAPAEEGGEASGDAAASEVTLAQGVTQEQFDQGLEIFTGQGGCQACHGPNGTGSTLGPRLTDSEWLHLSSPAASDIAGIIRSGVPEPIEYPAPMPPMGGATLTDDQIQALAGYVASISGS